MCVSVLFCFVCFSEKNFIQRITAQHSFYPGGSTPRNSLWGCAARFSKSCPYFRPKNVIFHTRFQTRLPKSIPVFRPGLSAETILSLLRFTSISNLHVSFSFLLNLINTFINSRSSLENHTRFQTKMGKVYTRFQNKKAQKPYPMGWHIPTVYSLYKGVPPGFFRTLISLYVVRSMHRS